MGTADIVGSVADSLAVDFPGIADSVEGSFVVAGSPVDTVDFVEDNPAVVDSLAAGKADFAVAGKIVEVVVRRRHFDWRLSPIPPDDSWHGWRRWC